MSIVDTPLGPTEFRSDDDFLTKVRKAVALSGRVTKGPITELANPFASTSGPFILTMRGPVAMDPNDPTDVALTELYIHAICAQLDFAAFLQTLVEAHASEEDATLFKMFWSGRGGPK